MLAGTYESAICWKEFGRLLLNMKNLIGTFFRLLIQQRQLILSMAGREVRSHYVGSLLGVAWTILQPLVMICVFWFVFSVGFRSKPMGNVPFVAWLTAGMAPWFYFSEIITSSATVVISNANLIKKTLFPSEILPIVRIVSSFVSHVFFLTILIILMIFLRLDFTLYYFQALYYLVCLWILALGFAWAVSSLNVFVRDVVHLVGIVIQVGFWATPIFWDINMMSQKIQFVLKLNPMYYVVQGYRDSFIYGVPFWRHPYQTVYFWCVAIFVFLGGAYIFRRLKLQFADVL